MFGTGGPLQGILSGIFDQKGVDAGMGCDGCKRKAFVGALRIGCESRRGIFTPAAGFSRAGGIRMHARPRRARIRRKSAPPFSQPRASAGQPNPQCGSPPASRPEGTEGHPPGFMQGHDVVGKTEDMGTGCRGHGGGSAFGEATADGCRGRRAQKGMTASGV